MALEPLLCFFFPKRVSGKIYVQPANDIIIVFFFAFFFLEWFVVLRFSFGQGLASGREWWFRNHIGYGRYGFRRFQFVRVEGANLARSGGRLNVAR